MCTLISGDEYEFHLELCIPKIFRLVNLNTAEGKESAISMYISHIQLKTIFSDEKINPKVIRYMNQLCTSTTEVYLSLLQSFHQFDPKYSQEFYSHWKAIIMKIKVSRRADAFIRHVDQFKVFIEHLRTAEHRCEQLAVLSVLRLYIEQVPANELENLKEHDNIDIVDKIGQLMKNPTILNQHEFLHEIDSMGHCIVSLKPTKIICDKLRLTYNRSGHEMWLDFNMKEKSIIFVTVSLNNPGDHSLAMVASPKLRSSQSDEFLVEVNGTWNVMISQREPFQKGVTIKMFFPIQIETSIWESIKNVFRFVRPAHAGSISQDYTTDFSENKLSTQESIDDSNFDTSSKRSQQNDSLISSMIPPKIIPPKQSATKTSQFGPSTSKFAIRQQLLQNKKTQLANRFAALDDNGRRITRGKVPIGNHSIDRNLTRRRRSVNLIARQQLFNDRNQQRDLLEREASDAQRAWLLLKEKLSKSAIDTFLKDSSSGPSNEPNWLMEPSLSIEPNRLIASNLSIQPLSIDPSLSIKPKLSVQPNREDDDISSGITLRDHTSVRNDSENEGDMSGIESDDNYCNNEWTQRPSRTQGNENDDFEMLLQETNLNQRDEAFQSPIQCSPRQFDPRQRPVNKMHWSQVEMNSSMQTFSSQQRGGVDMYSLSQPTTSRERFFIKPSPARNLFPTDSSIDRSNELIRALPEKSFANLSAMAVCTQNRDESNGKPEGSFEDSRNRPLTSPTRCVSQGKRTKLFDQRLESTQMTQSRLTVGNEVDFFEQQPESTQMSERSLAVGNEVKLFDLRSDSTQMLQGYFAVGNEVERFDRPPQSTQMSQRNLAVGNEVKLFDQRPELSHMSQRKLAVGNEVELFDQRQESPQMSQRSLAVGNEVKLFDQRPESSHMSQRSLAVGNEVKLFDQQPESPQMSQGNVAEEKEKFDQSKRATQNSLSVKSLPQNSSQNELEIELQESDNVEPFQKPSQISQMTTNHPVEIESQNLYEMFDPLATSTQATQFRPPQVVESSSQQQSQNDESLNRTSIANEGLVASQPTQKMSQLPNSSIRQIGKNEKSLRNDEPIESFNSFTQKTSQNRTQVVVPERSSRVTRRKFFLTKNSLQPENKKVESVLPSTGQPAPMSASINNSLTPRIKENELFVSPVRETQFSRSTRNSSQNRTAFFVPQSQEKPSTAKANEIPLSDKANGVSQVPSTSKTVSRDSTPKTSSQNYLKRNAKTESTSESVVPPVVKAHHSQNTSNSPQRNPPEKVIDWLVPQSQPTEITRGRLSKNLLAPKSSKTHIEVIESITLPTLANVILEKPPQSPSSPQKQIPVIRPNTPSKLTKDEPITQRKGVQQTSNSSPQISLRSTAFVPVVASTPITRKPMTVEVALRIQKQKYSQKRSEPDVALQEKSPTRNSSQNQIQIDQPSTDAAFDYSIKNSSKNRTELIKPTIPIETTVKNDSIIPPNEGQRTLNSPIRNALQIGTEMESLTKNLSQNQIPLTKSIVPIEETNQDDWIPSCETPKTSNLPAQKSHTKYDRGTTKRFFTRRISTYKSSTREERLFLGPGAAQKERIFTRKSKKRTKSGSRNKSSKTTNEPFQRPTHGRSKDHLASASDSMEIEISTDNVKINDAGMICDDKGCVFADDDELQAATLFYIENGGLSYLKQDQFKTLNAVRREHIERELQTVHTMMNSGLEALHNRDDSVTQLDPYMVTDDDKKVKKTPIKKQKTLKTLSRSTRNVSVTVSSQGRDGVHHSKKVSVAITHRRVSQYFVTNDETSSSSTLQPSMETKKEKTLSSKIGKTFKKPVKTPPHKKAGKVNSQEQANSTTLPTKTPQKLPKATTEIKNLNQGKTVTSLTKANRNSLTENVNVGRNDPPASDSMPNDPIIDEPMDFVNECQVDNRFATADIRCDLESCNDHMEDLFRRLNELVQDPVESCEQHRDFLMAFIECLQPIQLQQNAMRTDLAGIFNETIANIQSICDKALAQFEERLNKLQ